MRSVRLLIVEKSKKPIFVKLALSDRLCLGLVGMDITHKAYPLDITRKVYPLDVTHKEYPHERYYNFIS